MKDILKKIKIGHIVLLGAILATLLLEIQLWRPEFWFTIFALTYTLYSRHYLTQWHEPTSMNSAAMESLLEGLKIKRSLELILVLSGLCFGLFSIWLPLGLAKAGVILCAASALHLVMTLVLEWEVGILHDKGIQ